MAALTFTIADALGTHGEHEKNNPFSNDESEDDSEWEEADMMAAPQSKKKKQGGTRSAGTDGDEPAWRAVGRQRACGRELAVVDEEAAASAGRVPPRQPPGLPAAARLPLRAE